jgi:hypothetical protein
MERGSAPLILSDASFRGAGVVISRSTQQTTKIEAVKSRTTERELARTSSNVTRRCCRSEAAIIVPESVSK